MKTYCYSGSFKHYVEAETDEEAHSKFNKDFENVYDVEIIDWECY